MAELTQAFLEVLQAQGLRAMAARPATLSPRLREGAIAVSVAELETSPGGFSSYLGIYEGKELYGLRLKARVLLEILSPTAMGAGEGRRLLDLALSALSQGVPGVCLGQILTQAPAYDPVEDCFIGKVEASCRGWLCAVPDPSQPGELEHFILKGALT